MVLCILEEVRDVRMRRCFELSVVRYLLSVVGCLVGVLVEFWEVVVVFFGEK